MAGYLIVRLAPLLRFLPGVSLRVGGAVIAAGVPVPLPPGQAALTVAVALPLPRGRVDAWLDIPIWIEPGGTTTVDLARPTRFFTKTAFAALGASIPAAVVAHDLEEPGRSGGRMPESRLDLC